MGGLKALLGSAALLVGMAAGPAAQAQVSIGINIGGPPPVCPYGFYDYSPYACAPYGFYGPGYFYNGIFLGVGPWAGWGYAHGWGSHRFVNAGGGHYNGRGGYEANHGHFVRGYDDRGHGAPHGAAAAHGGSAHRASAPHGNAPHGGSAPHASAPHGGSAPHGSVPHGGGAAHGNGGDKHQ